MNQELDIIGVNLVTLKDLKKILKIGLVEIKILMNLYKIPNLMLYITIDVLNGFLLRNFKMLPILPRVVLVGFIQLNGPKDLPGIGILKIKNGKGFQLEKLH